MIELYFSPGACSFVPHVGLEAIRAATGQDFTTHMIKLHKGEQTTPEYVAMNPYAQVPALKVDGKPLVQIVAICDWLARSFPQAGLLPADPWEHSQALSRLAWINTTVHPTFTHVFMPQKFTDDETVQAELKRFNAALYLSQLEQIQQWVTEASPYLCGDRISFLDAYALTLLRWGGLAGIDPESLPIYWAYVQRVAATEPVAAAIATERLQLNVYRKAA